MRIFASQKMQIIIKSAFAAVLAAAAICTISALCSVKVGLTVCFDGKKIGTVESVQAFEELVEKVRDDAGALTYGDVPALTGVTYIYAEGERETALADSESLYSAVLERLRDDYRAAYGLYIDGKLLAANESADAVNAALVRARLDAQGGSDAEVYLNADIEVISLYYPDSVLKSADELPRMLAALTPQLYVAMKADDAGFDITYGEDAFFYLSANPDGSITVTSDGSATDVVVTDRTENTVTCEFTVKEEIIYKTEYEATDALYAGTYEKKCDGANGEKIVKYSVTYENGVEISRSVISETITAEAVNKVIYEGTKAKPLTVTTGTFIVPIDEGCYKISSTYGWRELYGERDFHRGLDFAAQSGTPIHAADGGLVTEVGYNDSLGYYVMILHDNGYTTVYAHMSKTLAVKGVRVAQGETIGKVGATGIATGSHLHFEVRIGDTRYDPQDFLPQ